MTSPRRETLCFGEFELDLGAYKLRRGGRSLRLTRQQMDLLILLIECRGQLVSRAEIVARLWNADVFVDVDTGINSAISKIRQALGDSAEAPRFVETVPAKGYRFIADVLVKDHAPSSVTDSAAPEHRAGEVRGRPRWLAAAATIALACAVAGGASPGGARPGMRRSRGWRSPSSLSNTWVNRRPSTSPTA